MLRALIGSRGTVGSSLLDSMTFDHVFNSDNIQDLVHWQFDQVVIAAPSGNRLAINRGHTTDSKDVETIIQCVQRARPRHTVILSSVDSVTATQTLYGHNRAALEHWLLESVPAAVLRLSTLIGPRIKKNVLYDIKHGQFLDQIDGGAETQWCILADLPELIAQAEPWTVRNIVSEPIAHSEIMARYCPEQLVTTHTDRVRYNQQPYCYTRQEIFAAMDQYML